MPRKRGPGRPRRVGRPIITGKYTQKQEYAIREIKGIVRKAEHSWTKKKPHTDHDRYDIINTCGKACFLDNAKSNTNNFAICPKCSKTICHCYPDCDALLLVKTLANKNKLYDIERNAQYLADQLECDWNTAIKYLLTTKYLNILTLL